jgi:hypothetical protein
VRRPSIKVLRKTFRDLSREDAAKIRRLCALADDPAELRTEVETLPRASAYLRMCYSTPFHNRPFRRAMVLQAIDEIVGTHGVEAVGPCHLTDGAPISYLNAGDAYASTLVYKRGTDNLFVSTLGDVAGRVRR